MTIESNNRSGELVPSDEVTSLIQYSLQQLGLNADCEVSLTFVDEAEMTELHIKWMDLPGPTDVLSFPMDEVKPNSKSNGPGIVGDIVLCPAFAERNEKQSLTKELELLTVHGVLHLLGFDHAQTKEEEAMFKLQDDLLEKWRATR